MNRFIITYAGDKYAIDLECPLDISIPYNFNGQQPNFYDVAPGTQIPFEYNNIIFDNNAGCNVPVFNFNIHCTGTHTETIGHILDEKDFYINNILPIKFISTIVITIDPIPFSNSDEKYHVEYGPDELIITSNQIKDALNAYDMSIMDALVIRTKPNDSSKMFRKYKGNMHPYLTNDAIKFISSTNVSHLIVDTPSIDRADDGGHLLNHKIFWNIDLPNITIKDCRTITEFAFIKNSIKDGTYFLQFLLPNFNSHVSPTRPILYRCIDG